MNHFSSNNGVVELQTPPSSNEANRAGREPTAAASERETASSEQSSSGRDANGRFAKGNRGGPGNPFGRQMAALRKRLQTKVTDEVIDRVADQLIKQAEEGDVPSAKLLFSYAIGKPTEAVDPDTLDVQEWNVMRQTSVDVQDWHELVKHPPVGLVCEVMRHTLPCLAAQFAEQMKDKLSPSGPSESNEGEEEYAEEEDERPKAKRSRSRKSRGPKTKGPVPAPSPNATNGAKGPTHGGVPSTKGTNGSGAVGESPSAAGDAHPCSTPETRP